MNAIKRLLRREPARLTAVAVAAVGVLTLFGVIEWSDVQIGAFARRIRCCAGIDPLARESRS